MKDRIAGQTAVTKDEFAELALGLTVDSAFTRLFTGVPGESAVEREARMDAAADIVADLRREDPMLAAYAERLLRTAPVPLHRPRSVGRRPRSRKAAA
ncbi:hypothetical protein ACIRD3_23795 [Kitasatospora sp. NPDC093550]|uniref:hypothetical protein n=1 Tax=Kitasatospora sp. NPDC093550 TaxID=3364089 RepID=UPI0038220A42